MRFDKGSRALYATDASNYRQVPIGVVIPRSVEGVMSSDGGGVPRARRADCLSRGGGTSLAGQCCNVAVVDRLSKYINRILDVDPEERGCPGGARAACSTISRRGRASTS